MKDQLIEYCLRLADTSLILGQRLGEWCGHGPILEEDIALTNISLDCIGQARGFRNLLIVEQPNGDYGQTIMRQFLVSAFQYFQFDALRNSGDKTIAALAE